MARAARPGLPELTHWARAPHCLGAGGILAQTWEVGLPPGFSRGISGGGEEGGSKDEQALEVLGFLASPSAVLTSGKSLPHSSLGF